MALIVCLRRPRTRDLLRGAADLPRRDVCLVLETAAVLVVEAAREGIRIAGIDLHMRGAFIDASGTPQQSTLYGGCLSQNALGYGDSGIVSFLCTPRACPPLLLWRPRP